MSTTVSYNSQVIATVSNDTEVLQTQGKWLTDNITIVDSSSGGGSAVIVDTVDSAGGIIRSITTTINDVWTGGSY